MKYDFPVKSHIVGIVETLHDAGFESYIVGGAIRDHLQNREPKDYDIATQATPEQVREVFGRRRARIIGRRFQLVHLMNGNEIIEISTFRKTPSERNHDENLPENMLVFDNDFGTAEEDALRRDFTVNSLFYDPVSKELKDFTGQGLSDIENKLVRVIGTPEVRFEEDPVRMLRALKLVGQYNFSLEAGTESALFASLPLIKHASTSRLALELEKVLASAYGDMHLQAFHDYGLLPYFLPFLEEHWGQPEMERALDLLAERNYRVDHGFYRNSISLAMAALALPFVEMDLQGKTGELWDVHPGTAAQVVDEYLEKMFLPQNMVRRLIDSAKRVLLIQPSLFNYDTVSSPDRVMGQSGYPHGRELMVIQNQLGAQNPELEEFWQKVTTRRPQNNNRRRPGKKRFDRNGGNNDNHSSDNNRRPFSGNR
ncbi:MAG: hypothetical protein PHS41_04910 [Victivallaceae bacterium]|nr:hypothetical protein [Victivallaceae bacterium]